MQGHRFDPGQRTEPCTLQRAAKESGEQQQLRTTTLEAAVSSAEFGKHSTLAVINPISPKSSFPSHSLNGRLVNTQQEYTILTVRHWTSQNGQKQQDRLLVNLLRVVSIMPQTTHVVSFRISLGSKRNRRN